MAKRDQRGNKSAKSKAHRSEKASGRPAAKSGRAEAPEQLTPQAPASESAESTRVDEGRDRDHQPSAGAAGRDPVATTAITSLRSKLASTSAQRMGGGRRIRTPLPTSSDLPDAAGAPKQRLGSERRMGVPPSASSVRMHPAGAPTQPLGSGTRIRTALPQPVAGELDEINLGGGAGRIRQGRGARLRGRRQNPMPRQSRKAKLEAKAAQFRDIQDFFHNPSLFSLRGKQLDTSSTPEEIEVRKGEVRYQIQIMRSLVAVLTEELNELEQALPQTSADQITPTRS